jgi:hypothetical protein
MIGGGSETCGDFDGGFDKRLLGVLSELHNILGQIPQPNSDTKVVQIAGSCAVQRMERTFRRQSVMSEWNRQQGQIYCFAPSCRSLLTLINLNSIYEGLPKTRGTSISAYIRWVLAIAFQSIQYVPHTQVTDFSRCFYELLPPMPIFEGR